MEQKHIGPYRPRCLVVVDVVVVVVLVVVVVVVVDVVALVVDVVVGITAINDLCVFLTCVKCVKASKKHTSPARGARLLQMCVSPGPNTTFQSMFPV